MLVKELKKLLENLDESKEIEISICEEERVVCSSGEFLELGDYGEVGYILEFGDRDWMREEDDVEDMDDES